MNDQTTSTRKDCYADIALNLPLPRSYQYAIPESFVPVIRIGSLTQVPFGKTSSRGCVVALTSEKKHPELKEIHKILSPDFTIDQDLVDLAKWISDYYFCSWGEALSCVSFIGFNDCVKRSEKWIVLKNPASFQKPDDFASLTPKQSQLIRFFLQNKKDRFKLSFLARNSDVSYSIIRNLAQKGILEYLSITEERTDGYEDILPGSVPLEMNPYQKSAFDHLQNAIEENRYAGFLLNGVTGSGKTEIYLQALQKVFDQGRQAIILVPEIALTPQTLERFRSRFGKRIGVYHSQLSMGQKYDMWRAIKEGRIECLVGPRSAVFAPFPNLGLIVVDEEHESTYKQNEVPRYHARDVALMRAKTRRAVAILGSATPSLESFHNARKGKISLLILPARIKDTPLPSVELIDMAKEMAERKTLDLFSKRLENSIHKRLQNGEQVILFLNRRGFANFLLCPKCHHIITCDHCSVTMTYHKIGHKLVCHYCGEVKDVPTLCPNCESENLALIGTGTQRIEDELIKKFPTARILRLDSDSLGTRKSFLQKWKAITSGEVDILFGTQILAKGFDLAPVTLVGVISADHSLFLPDFRSAERTFALLTQVAGRSGRGDKPGEVVIQTFLPHHYSIADALSQNYSVFAERELKNRKALRFPPFYKLVSVLFTGKNPKLISERIQRFANILRILRNQYRLNQITILGPAPSPIAKIGDHFRFRLILRSEKNDEMRRLLKSSLDKFHSLKLKGAFHISIDVDPYELL
ncbi:primosomal protein N' [Candidatus Sumerlaeota bacterium]|nr:primosomal protein N' [Candidatus Sumerlaeota bacterium]